jgi:hypothetical protein
MVPSIKVHVSLNPTMMLPRITSTNPIQIKRVSGSFKVIGDNKATHKGVVATNTTELVTVVYSRDVIQAAKCKARHRPESKASKKSQRLWNWSSERWRKKTTGARIIVAIANLYAAITSDGA